MHYYKAILWGRVNSISKFVSTQFSEITKYFPVESKNNVHNCTVLPYKEDYLHTVPCQSLKYTFH